MWRLERRREGGRGRRELDGEGEGVVKYGEDRGLGHYILALLEQI